MSYLAFYRKYRPSLFSEVIGQDTTIEILKQSVNNNTISHAYLFYGPRGTGKTSVAKIFAKTVNCSSPKNGERCGKCELCKSIDENSIDIIEIDAASNNGVDEIREIRNNVKLVPTVGKYKVYIIDEVHMLSIGAFNALLKTLEEPPEHVIFILATTEIQKIPLTIISRCQRFNFKKISNRLMVELLTKIVKSENKKVSSDILELVATLSDGCVRDATNLLDQVISTNDNTITVDNIYSITGELSNSEISLFFDCIVDNNIELGLNLINKYYEDGKNYINITNKLILLVRDIHINNNIKDYFKQSRSQELEKYTDLSNEILVIISNNLLKLLNELKKSTNQKIIFEINFFEVLSLIHETKQDKQLAEPKEEEKVIEKDQKNEQIIRKNEIISREIILVRVNNVLTEANKEVLKQIKNQILSYEEYISNKKFNVVAKILINGIPVVASNNYVMYTFKDEIYLPLFYKNLKEIEKFIEMVHNFKCKAVAISEIEWKKEKEEYINNKNNGIIYSLKEEPKENVNNKKIDTSAVDIFGEESISVK